VLHDGDLTYALAVPARALGGPRAAYTAVNAGLLRGLELLGTRAELSAGGPAVPPHSGPCFATAAAGEIVARGEKLVGSAQARLDGALLQHGSILVRSNQNDLQGLRDGPSVVSAPSADTPERHLSGLDLAEVRAALVEGLRRTLGGHWYKDGYRSAETIEAERLEEQRYARDEWTWRL
jgi:lipoate-protein ligase A